MQSTVLNKLMFPMLLLALTACNKQHGQTLEEKPAYVQEKPVSQEMLPNLVNFIPAGQLLKAAGFANGKLFIADSEQGLFAYDLPDYTRRNVQQAWFGEEASVICQRFNHDAIDIIPISALLTHELSGFEVKAATCGNIQADMSPEVILLLEKAGKLNLMAGTLDKNLQVKEWRIVASVKSPGTGQYMLLPELIEHTARGLLILGYSQGSWILMQHILPGAFIEPFEYKHTDHDEMWAAYINLDRAAAKLMWNGGANSIGKLDEYLTSIDTQLTSDPERYFDRITAIFNRLDPNQDTDVAFRLAEVYKHWKTNNFNKGADS
ncbi:hypothetical protein SG34_014175 [Thalassomonas viridans]|uniref:Uncharacterized protein n=1 Tax=Thalassomonas viridans TaxID=137584 RepID=A0AAE9Z9S2_9GAMM|nr:hypothetical protein [Thalassomonas viridans]WDE07928.1 hypothetical protein SG34_014175 [Thalassomonas viridans]